MDIKNVFKVSPSAFIKAKSESVAQRKNLKTDDTTDRDGNGQSPHGRPSKDHPMSEEEQNDALKRLQQMGPMQEHQWEVRVLTQFPDRLSLQIWDQKGVLLRTLQEHDLRSLAQNPEPNRGQWLKTSA